MDAGWQALPGRAAAIDEDDAGAIAEDKIERAVLVDVIEHAPGEILDGFIANDKLAHKAAARAWCLRRHTAAQVGHRGEATVIALREPAATGLQVEAAEAIGRAAPRLGGGAWPSMVFIAVAEQQQRPLGHRLDGDEDDAHGSARTIREYAR